MVVLIDGGSTHNFIDHAIVQKYSLPVLKNRTFQVTVANGEKIDCVGLCPSLTINIQGQPLIADYYVLPVAACQVVLGVQWLTTLGPIEMDYSRLTMTFTKGGKTCTFHGLK